MDKGSGDRLQELLDDLNQKITNYVQSTNAMKKMSVARLALWQYLVLEHTLG